MDSVREGINSLLLGSNDLLFGWRLAVVTFWHEGANAALLLLLAAAVLAITVQLRREGRVRREAALLQTVGNGLATASSASQLTALFFDTLFTAVPLHGACFYLAAGPSTPFLLRDRRPAASGAPGEPFETDPVVAQTPPGKSDRPRWEPESRIDSSREEPWITHKGFAIVWIPVMIDGHPQALVQLATATDRDAATIRARAGFLRTLLAPILARIAAADREERLEARTIEAAVVSGASQTLLSTALGPDELGGLLLDLVVRVTEADAGLVVVGSDDERAPARVLASSGIEPDHLPAFLATIGRQSPVAPPDPSILELGPDDRGPATLLRQAGFRTALQVTVGSGPGSFVRMILARRSGSFGESHLRICQLNAGRLALALKNRAFHEAVFSEYKEMLVAMVTTHESSSPYLDGHARRISHLVGEVAQGLGLAPAEVAGLRLAGQLHDVGMIGLGGEILGKPARLSPREYDLVKHHPTLGAAVTTPIRLPIPIAPLILHHHERYDGLGYPTGLKATEIPLGARILALAEVFDAMVTRRNYREALSFAQAVARLRQMAGTQLDPDVVEAFIRTVPAQRWDAIATAAATADARAPSA